MNITEATVLCLESWRGEVLAGRKRSDWEHPSALLRGIRSDADAFDFVRDIFDYVALPRDAFTSALGLHELAQEPPESLPTRLRLALKVGGIASFGVPWGVVPIVKQRFRAHLSDILVSSKEPPRDMLRRATQQQIELDLDVLGAPVFGPEGVAAETERLIALVRNPEVSRISIRVARLVPSLTGWTSERAPQRFIEAAHGVLDACVVEGVAVTVTADTYAEALLMPAFVEAVSADPRYRELHFGVEVLAELPESVSIIEQLLTARGESAGHVHPLEVRVTARTITPAETIRSIERGLPVPSIVDATARDAQWIRVVLALCQPKAAAVLRPVVASEDPTLLAIARVLWQRDAQGAESGELCAVLGMGRAPELEQALRATGMTVRRQVPMVDPHEFAHALPAVLETLAMVVTESSPYELGATLLRDDRAAIELQRERVGAAAQLAVEEEPHSHRLQDRAREWEPSERGTPLMYRPPTEAYRFDTGGLTAAVMQLHRDADRPIRVRADQQARIPVISDSGFACEPDTDAAQHRNRVWMRAQLKRAAQHTAERAPGAAGVRAARTGAWALDPVMGIAAAAGLAWSGWTHGDRATLMRRTALALVVARDRLGEVIASERGLPVSEIDHEIGYMIDTARYVASRAEGLRTVRGATFTPRALTLVAVDALTSPGELAEMLLSVLAAGSGVVIVAHEAIARTTAVLIEELTAVGIPKNTATLIVASENESFADCVLRVTEHSSCDQALYAIGKDLARRVRRVSPTLPRDVRVRGLGTVVVAPSADVGAAVPEIIESAYAAAGTHHRSTRAVIMLSATGKTDEFLQKLADAVRGVVPGHTGSADFSGHDDDPCDVTVGPLPYPVSPAQRRALTELAPGEQWLVRPEQLDEAGRLWSPGVRTGVQVDAQFWADAEGVPVIGVIAAHSMRDAITKQHRIGGGQVAALQSLDASDIIPWLEQTEAASLAVNKATTGARVERFPSGVWHSAQSTWQPLAAAPHRLIPLGAWSLRKGTKSETLHLRGLDPRIGSLIETVQPALDYESFDLVRRAALADELAWRTQFGVLRDASALTTEHNIVRYRSVAVHLRLAENGELAALIRLLAAGILSGSPLTVSAGVEMPTALLRVLRMHHIPYVTESDETWLERASVQGGRVAGPSEAVAERIRLIGGDPVRVTEWMAAQSAVSVWARPVTMAGPIELLGFVREQAVSIATTRHGMRATIQGVEEWLHDLTE